MVLLCTWTSICGALKFIKFYYAAFLACYTGALVILVSPGLTRCDHVDGVWVASVDWYVTHSELAPHVQLM